MRFSRVGLRFSRVGWDLAVCRWDLVEWGQDLAVCWCDLAECCDLLPICQHHLVHYNWQFGTQLATAHTALAAALFYILQRLVPGAMNKFGTSSQWRNELLFTSEWCFYLWERVTLNASCLWKLRQGHLAVVRNDTSQKPDSYRWTVPFQ